MRGSLLALVAPGPDSKIVTSEALAKANADLRARLAAKDEHIPPREAGSVTITEDQGVTGVESPQPDGMGVRMLPFVPNPFSDSVTIAWEQRVAGNVSVEVFDIQGKMVATHKMTGVQGKQEWVWDGRNARGSKAPAGTYVIAVKGEGFWGARQLVKTAE